MLAQKKNLSNWKCGQRKSISKHTKIVYIWKNVVTNPHEQNSYSMLNYLLTKKTRYKQQEV